MKRAPLIVAFVSFLISLSALFYAKTSSELVYVDVNKLVEGYSRTKIIKKEMEKQTSDIKSNADTLFTKWQQELQSFEKERTSLSEKELKLKQQLLANKQQQINNYQESVQKKLSEENQKNSQTIINDINDYVKEYGKKHNYKIIFGASGGGNIMYADEATDLTKEVLEGLNEQYGDKK